MARRKAAAKRWTVRLEKPGVSWQRLRRAQGMRGFRDEVVWTPEPRAGVQLELRAFA